MFFKQVLLPFVLSVGLAACTKGAISDEIAPVATNIAVYSAGGSVVSGTIDSEVLGTKRLRLPATAQGVNLSQNNETLAWYTIEMNPDGDRSSRQGAHPDRAQVDKHLLVGLPPLKSGELKFNYVLPEITWTPQLSATIIDSRYLTLQLQAAIRMGASQEYKNCNVILVLNNEVSIDKLSGDTYNLNSFDLYPNRNVVYKLDNKVLTYSYLREWHTYAGKDEVHVLIQVTNPFSIDLNQTPYSVESHQINVESGIVEKQVRQGEVLYLGAGIDSSIDTFRWVKITESTTKKALAFNHRISYEITNKSDQEKTLRLVSQRVLGAEHRSVYHFAKPPDATPENTLVWMLVLKPRSTQTLEYDYDADVKDVDGENGFEGGG